MIKIYLRSFIPLFACFILLAGCEHPTDQSAPEDAISKSQKWQNIKGALDYEREVTKDPKTGEVPAERLYEAYQYAKQLQKEAAQDNNRNADVLLHEANWKSRGPDNIGGRTRAIHIDERDPERKKIWVGGVSGGLWVTEDITKSDPEWKLIDDFWESLSIAGIAQDPNNPEVMYVSTGEAYTGDVRGVGVFKTTDGGNTWDLLPTPIGTAFRYIQDVVVWKNSDVYVGTWSGGLYRSQDGGSSWDRVLSSARVHDIYLMEDLIFVSTSTTIYRSGTGDLGDFENIGEGNTGFPTDINRIEMAVCPSDPNIIYFVGAIPLQSGGATESSLFVTPNGGNTWFEKSFGGFQGFASNQAWYDLELAVNPDNCSEMFAGGVGLIKTNNSGNSWQGIGGIHVDHHIHLYDKEKPGVIYYGNDGGIWRTQNGAQTIQDKNGGYVTTQFYACGMHPEAGSNYFIGGTQDNSSLKIDSDDIGPAQVMRGGDGVFAFIDQNEPNIQIVSSQFGNYQAYLNGFPGQSISADVNGRFINEADYDDNQNILYTQTFSGDYFRWKIDENLAETVDITGITTNVSSVLADPNVENQVYFGNRNSQLVRVKNAHEGTQVSGELVYNFPGSNTISSVYLDKLSASDILVTFSNYGLSNNVYISRDEGVSFIGIEGNLPDMPVRWAMFDPANHDRAILGTQAGLWTTEMIDGDNTVWMPSSEMPIVPVRMLQIRESDKKVLAATYGRGLYTSDLFAAPAAIIKIPKFVYAGQSITADASNSILANSFEWDFGDGEMSQEEIVEHTYNQPGKFQVTLTVNSELTTSQEIIVLPIRPLPYLTTEAEYGGDFESNELHFGAFSENGSVFERGKSTITGKNGTKSGENAYVLGLNEPEYAPNTVAYLYTPGFDFSDNTLYTLSFYSRFLIQNLFDGFKLEYSTDFGASWRQLGDRSDPNWYNYLNQNIERGIFNQGESYFTNVAPAFQEFVVDASELSGESFVGFRFVFKSDNEDNLIGVAIDDFTIQKFDGDPQTEIVNQNAEYTADSEMTISWSTSPEYQAEKFEIERSFNGVTYEVIKTVNAKGKSTLQSQSYTLSYSELRPLLFFRIHSINKNDDIGYNYDFYAPTMVVRRNIDENKVNKIFPNPITDFVNVTFTSVIEEQIQLRLFDPAGRLIREQTGIPGEVFIRMDNLALPGGIYMLNVKIGNKEDQTYKLLSAPE